MSDDPGRQGLFSDDDQTPAGAFVQITEVWAKQDDVDDALDRRDAYGRVPVVVRVRQRPPLRVELLAIAGILVLASIIVPADVVLRWLLVLVAVVATVVALVSRVILRIPAGSVGLVMRAGHHDRVLSEGIHRVNPFLVLTHVVTTREIAFDVPIPEVRSADGIAVSVDLLLTLGITDPAKLVYSITTTDLDQIAQASTQEAVRTLVRGIEALATLDLGREEADSLRATIDAKLAPYGVDVRSAAFTRVVLPAALTASLEARRLATVQLAEAEQLHALDRRRLADRAALLAHEAEARRAAVEHEAAVEATRLAKLEERIGASPNAARYDLETQRLRVAQQLAGNSRAVVSLGGPELVRDLLAAREGALAETAPPEPVPSTNGAATAPTRPEDQPAPPEPAAPEPVAPAPVAPTRGRSRRG